MRGGVIGGKSMLGLGRVGEKVYRCIAERWVFTVLEGIGVETLPAVGQRKW